MPQIKLPEVQGSDKWYVTVEPHPMQAGRWKCVIHLNGSRLFEGGAFRPAKSAASAKRAMLRLRMMIYYGSAPRSGGEEMIDDRA